jgi:hypothetical protein
MGAKAGDVNDMALHKFSRQTQAALYGAGTGRSPMICTSLTFAARAGFRGAASHKPFAYNASFQKSAE